MAQPDTLPTNGSVDSTDPLLITNFKAVRRVSAPLVGIETTDATATIAGLRKVLPANTPILEWDVARGCRGVNDTGKAAFNGLNLDPIASVNCAETLLAAERLPAQSVIFLHNFHRQLHEVAVVQAFWNLRDIYKLNKRTAVALAPSFHWPDEIAGDVITFDEPLPDRQALSHLLDVQHTNAGLAKPDDDLRTQALDAMVGLPYFTAENVTAMSLSKAGINVPKLWDRKIKALENTDGLKVWRPRVAGACALEYLKGIDNAVAFMQKLIDVNAFGCIVFIDEADKALSGGMSEHVGDSGVSKDQVGQVLSYVEDNGSLGVMLAGWAGTGKTELAKATAVTSGKPLIILDLGALKGAGDSHVGAAERAIRYALKVVTATSEGRVLFIFTANKTTMFTPEMNRRLPDQFFFDTPDDAGRAAIWPVYVKRNGLTPSQAKFPKGFDTGWTGAEIRRACERAAMFGCTVVEASRFIIPSSISGARTLEQLRREADGRFLSASYPGLYRLNRVADDASRQIDL